MACIYNLEQLDIFVLKFSNVFLFFRYVNYHFKPCDGVSAGLNGLN